MTADPADVDVTMGYVVTKQRKKQNISERLNESLSLR